MTDHRLDILVLTELFLPTKGGTAVWFGEVYRRLGGKNIHILTARVPDCDTVDREHPNSIHRLDLRRVPWLRPESLGMYLKLFFAGLWLILRHRFAAVHAGRGLPEGLVAWALARIGRRPLVVYVHGEELTSWGQGRKYQTLCFVLRHAQRVIVNSSFTRDLVTDLGVLPSRIELIHPGVDIHRFRPGLETADLRAVLGLGERAKLILSVGRLQRRKGFDKVIQTLPGLIESGEDVHYALIGIGEDRDYLADLAREGHIADRVHFLGHVSAEDLPRWYNACDLFIMANRELNGDTEGFGMVFIEAGACGKPVIAGQAGGTASSVLDGKTGLRIDGTDEGQIARAVKALLDEPETAARMGSAGLERARNEMSWESVADKTLDLHLKTLKS